MAQRVGTANLPLHGGQVPRWLADRMTRLGAVISEAIVHHYGRDELLRRLAHPFWFQSFGAVMGMDWHSSGITTSVIGALKRGLAPLERELGLHVCGGRGRFSRQTPHELVSIGERVGFDGAALATASRLVAKVDSAAVQDGFQLYLHGFIVTDDGHWVVVQQGMNGELKQAADTTGFPRGWRALSTSRTPQLKAQGRARSSTSHHRVEASRRMQLELLGSLGPDGIARELSKLEARDTLPIMSRHPPQMLLPHLDLPAHHEVRASDVIAHRLHGNLAAAADRGPTDFPELLLTPGVGTRTVRRNVVTAIGVGLEWHGGHLRGLWMGVAPSHLGLLSEICRPQRLGGRAT
jgi:hypothetical protein